MTVDTTPQFRPFDQPVEPIRLVDEDGTLLPGAEPLLGPEEVREGLWLMTLARTFDAKCFSLQRQGKLGTFAPIVGQEACTAGSGMALNPALDWICPQYRELPAQIHHGYPLELVALYRMGHPSGGHVPDGVRMVQFNISLAAQIPHAVGLGWGLKLQGEPGIAVAYFGDGASSEGDFHESCNLAGVQQVPCIFFLQNNQWAISTPRSSQSQVADLASRAIGYGIHGVSVDGNDLLAVHKVTHEARVRGLAGEGPTLIEAHTFRMWAHTTADDPTRYVDPEVKARWENRDPLLRMQRYLTRLGEWDEDATAACERDATEAVEAVFERAGQVAAAGPEAIYEHVFAEPTPALERRRRFDLAVEG